MTDAIRQLFDKNRRFAGTERGPGPSIHDPGFVSVCCCDARVPQGAIFGTSPGDHFTVANIGNSVRTRDPSGEPIVSGSVLYPFVEAEPAVLFVVGHTDCGAVTAAYRQVSEGTCAERPELQNELDLLVPYIERGLERIDPDRGDDETIVRLAEYNVDRQVEVLTPEVDGVPVVGAMCDLHGVYSSSRREVHLVNYEGSRARNALPAKLREYFERKLEY